MACRSFCDVPLRATAVIFRGLQTRAFEIQSAQILRARMAKKKIVCLVGFMAAGKSTVGQDLAQRLGWKFIDLDTLIEERERATVSEIFQRSGQAAFRNVENATLQEVLQDGGAPAVIALGGGTFARRENQDAVAQAGVYTVHLSAQAEELWRRAHLDGAPQRPMMRDREGFDALLSGRLPEYHRADCEITTDDKSVAAVVKEIEQCLKREGIA